MVKPRIIARLDVKTDNVVKSIRFDGLRIMGKPEELATRYYEQGADELLYIDTVASLYGRNALTEVVKEAASHIFIPMTVGGGIRSLEDARLLLRCGADKVAINTAAVKNPPLLRELANVLGAQAVVLSVQAKRIGNGKWEAYIDNGRETTGLDVLEWVRTAESLGAGEILLTSVDQDGTGLGFDVELVATVSSAVNIPVIAAGGAKVPEDVAKAFPEMGADAIAVASMLHYQRAEVSDIKRALAQVGVRTAKH
jgi:imidazole glycerol-phosphate synthase subunit HisF